MPPVKKGDRVVMKNWPEITTIVADVFWHDSDARWVIIVDWGMHGISKVYGDDEGKTWIRLSQQQLVSLDMNVN